MRPLDADEIIKKQRDLARRTCDEVYANDWHNPVILGMASMYGIVADAPTIDLVKHGKWFIDDDFNSLTFGCYKCSECGEWYHDKHNYCPYCGAKMESDDKE